LTLVVFWKIDVRLDSPYLQQIAFIRKMHINAIVCRTSIRRFKRANYELIDQLNFVGSYTKLFLGGKATFNKKIKKKVPGTGFQTGTSTPRPTIWSGASWISPATTQQARPSTSSTLALHGNSIMIMAVQSVRTPRASLPATASGRRGLGGMTR
jgi:hypothetical protein